MDATDGTALVIKAGFLEPPPWSIPHRAVTRDRQALFLELRPERAAERLIVRYCQRQHYAYEREIRSFANIDRQFAERMIARFKEALCRPGNGLERTAWLFR